MRPPVILVATATFLLAACSGTTPPIPGSLPTPASEAAATAAAQKTPSSLPLPTEAPVATRKAAHDGITFTLDMYPLRREGKAVLLTARLTAVEVPAGGAQIGDGWNLLNTVNDTTDPNFAFDSGFKLVDPAAQVVHLPARIDGVDACTRSNDHVWKRGDVRWISCLFAVPAGDRDHLMVQAQQFGGFGNVPLQ